MSEPDGHHISGYDPALAGQLLSEAANIVRSLGFAAPHVVLIGGLVPGHRPIDKGAWLLHGHVHERWQVRDRMINVGVDVWDYRPEPEHVLGDLVTAPARHQTRSG